MLVNFSFNTPSGEKINSLLILSKSNYIKFFRILNGSVFGVKVTPAGLLIEIFPDHIFGIDRIDQGSEKPLAMDSKQSRELVAFAKKAGVVHAVNFNYRYYPIVQQSAKMVQKKELGRIFAVQGCYKQDWLLYESDWNWRLEPKYAGQSRAVGDIG